MTLLAVLAHEVCKLTVRVVVHLHIHVVADQVWSSSLIICCHSCNEVQENFIFEKGALWLIVGIEKGKMNI